MPPATLQPLLGRQETSKTSKSQTIGLISGIIGLALLSSIFWHTIHYFQDHVHSNPFYIFLYPILGASFIALALPLLLYLTFRKEYSDIKPLYPHHYAFLARRIFSMLAQNEKKVTAKEL